MKVYDDTSEKLISVKMEFTLTELRDITEAYTSLINQNIFKSFHKDLINNFLTLHNSLSKIYTNNK